ncbi:hypothetical protein SELMODRAFT_69065, partial [Selaginella moellendorffii]
LYCLDCRGEALCSGCSPQHRDHHVVQIRRSSYHDVVRVSELQKVLDLGGVQTYIINSARVVFLNARPQPRHAKGVTKTCEICDRSLLDTFRYCSLGCKRSLGTLKLGRPSPSPSPSVSMEEAAAAARVVKSKKPPGSPMAVNSPELSPPTPPPTRTAKRRKGTPHRAPFGSAI